MKKDIEVNYENLKNNLLGKAERKRTIVPIFKEHNRRVEKLIGQVEPLIFG